jgi:hypothetical protein
VYVLFWGSGDWRLPRRVNTVAHAAVHAGRVSGPIALGVSAGLEMASEAISFTRDEGEAEALGRRFKRHMAQIPFARKYPINLIGHSLGARVLHYALASHDWSDYKLRDCILLGGAADAEDEDWPDCADELRGNLYNVWSEDDQVLKLLLKNLNRLPGRPDEEPVGLGPISWSYPGKIVNRKYKLGHGEYWQNLEYILSRVWPRFRQSRTPLLSCPECEGGVTVACEACEGEGGIECDTCDDDCAVQCDACEGEGGYECSDCDGDGTIACERCDGEGQVACGYCDEEGCGHCDDSGSRTCSGCDGVGELWCGTCDGEGAVACDDCESEGAVACDECEGEGAVECDECEGEGEVECDECEGSGLYEA